MIRTVSLSDAERISEIYNYYIKNTVITFEELSVSKEEIASRIEKNIGGGNPYIVFEEGGYVVAYASVSRWRMKSSFGITYETSIYVDHNYVGGGIGTLLYKELIRESRLVGIHSLIAVLSIPNENSRKIHLALGFDRVGTVREAGLKLGRYVDVEYWQLMLGDSVKDQNI